MKDFSIIPLFPLALYKSKFRELSHLELDTITTYPVEKQPLGNSSSQAPYFLDTAGLEQLKSDIDQHIDTYVKEVMKAPYEVYHTNSVISGVLYIKSSYIQPTISFHRMQPPYLLSWEPTEFNTFNSMEWTVPVEDGDIIIFPSTLFHYVKPNISNKDRISVAFNTFARGHIKTESAGADLILN